MIIIKEVGWMLTEKMEEYLEALFKLSSEKDELSPTRVAEYLGVTAPTVLDMLHRLEADGFVRYSSKGKGRSKDKGHGRHKKAIALTAKGQRAAKTLVRRHRLSERFLTDVLGLDWESAHREACKLEHVISPEVEERLAEMLGNPDTCPHGHPIPDENGHFKEEGEDIKPLCELCADDKACIAMVDEEEPKLLQYLANLGMLPDVDVEIKEVAPFGGPFLVKVGDTQYALGREVASKIWTKKKKGGGVKRKRRRRGGEDSSQR
jgi:DtxR family Mn-dependent transcriptional regulator